jgi:predicted dinucleotide-binding enzyme
MTYSIIGSGAVGTALAGQFARSGVMVGIANTRGPDSMAHRDVAKTAPTWQGKVVVDATNAFSNSATQRSVSARSRKAVSSCRHGTRAGHP